MPIQKGKNILIVDYNKDVTQLFKLFLEYDGYKVDAFTDPIDALSSFKKDEYDLVLLDLKIPTMNSMVFSQKLQNIDPTLIFGFITANKEDVEHLKKSNPDIEKIVIYESIWLNELRTKVNSFLFN
jgi:DNA-binding response OmpR family regulator